MCVCVCVCSSLRVNDLTLILLTWRKWWAPNNASKQQMGFNSAFKGLILAVAVLPAVCALLYSLLHCFSCNPERLVVRLICTPCVQIVVTPGTRDALILPSYWYNFNPFLLFHDDLRLSAARTHARTHARADARFIIGVKSVCCQYQLYERSCILHYWLFVSLCTFLSRTDMTASILFVSAQEVTRKKLRWCCMDSSGSG